MISGGLAGILKSRWCR